MKPLFPPPERHDPPSGITIPGDLRYQRFIRWITILGGLAVFLWLAPEDNHVTIVTLLGVTLSTILVLRWFLISLGGQTVTPRYFLTAMILLGTLTGLGSSLLTVLLMLFKNAQHSHLYPDFPLSLMGAVLARAPVWMLAGALTGASLACLLLARTTDHPR